MGKISWDDAASRELLVILIDIKAKGNSKFVWPSIANNVTARVPNFSANGDQCKNHLDSLKMKFKKFEDLNKLTGIAYNPQTKEVDVHERSTERWNAFLEKHKRHGLSIAKSGLPNSDLIYRLFGGTTAQGVGGTFSSSMAKDPSYLTQQNAPEAEEKSDDGEEGSGNSDEDHALKLDGHLSGSESEAAANPVVVKRKPRTGTKLKSDECIDYDEKKRRETSFDSVIQLLSANDIGSSSSKSLKKLVSEALTRMEVSTKRGDEYFVAAMKFLKDVDDANEFLALENDKQRCIYLKELDNYSIRRIKKITPGRAINFYKAASKNRWREWR